ncbi:MAG: hypothetical protein WCP22_05235 [Chlamydiota bacterium]
MPMLIETAAEWGYVSGRCASLEGSLLDAGFFRELLRARTAAEAHALLSKTTYAGLFPHPATLDAYDRLLKNHLRDGLHSLQAGSPPQSPMEIPLREMELQDVHELLARQGLARASGDEVERWAARLGGGFPWLGGFAVPAERRSLFASQPVRALSLWVDAAYLAEMIALAEKQPGFSPYVAALVSLTALEVCWRAFRGGLGIDWLDGFFLRDPLPIPPMGSLAAAGRERSPAALVKLLGPPDFAPPMDDLAENFGREADDYLTRIARRGAYEVCGPGRVLYYARRLWVEQFNLRLCIAAVLTPLDRRQARARLRSG